MKIQPIPSLTSLIPFSMAGLYTVLMTITVGSFLTASLVWGPVKTLAGLLAVGYLFCNLL